MTLAIRPAEPGDVAALTELYNHYIATTAITFDIEPMTVETRAEWLSHYAPSGRHRLLVGHDGPVLVGYASTSPFAVKAAYETSVEVSVYVAPGRARRGIGTALYEALFASVADEDIHRAYAGITLPNEASVRLHEQFGFTPVGVYREVGRKFGRYHDVLRMQKDF
jgi:phosphinothricin acetyltransferase